MFIEAGGNPLHILQSLGQSVWLEGIHRGIVMGPQLSHLINRDRIAGVDSNPIRLAAAYTGDSAYRESIAELRAAGVAGRQIYERLGVDDVRRIADRLRRVYNNSGGRDGYASLELSPALAYDADGTESEARRLWGVIDKPNIMINVPATDAGVVAIRRVVAAGVNVNATLIFGARRYREVTDAYASGLEDRAAAGRSLEGIASVASVFVSCIDTVVDKQLEAIRQPAKAARAQNLRGRAAVAVARFVYQRYKSAILSARWQALAARHAQTQRLRWVHTHTENPHYSDVKYVNDLVGRDTVTTLSVNTLDAYRDHGLTAPTLEQNLLDVCAQFAELEELGIDLDRVSAQLERESVDAIVGSVNAALARLHSAV